MSRSGKEWLLDILFVMLGFVIGYLSAGGTTVQTYYPKSNPEVECLINSGGIACYPKYYLPVITNELGETEA